MKRLRWNPGAFLLGLLAVSAMPAGADLSAFVATVGFDEDANLERSLGAGIRWGKSAGLIGGETSILIARPDRKFGAGIGKEAATAIFYEGRIVVGVPVGEIRPFVGVGLGAVTLTSTSPDVPSDKEQFLSQALEAVSDLQTNTSVSYGAGVRYALSDRLDLRVDLRQYLVFSVKGLAARQLTRQLEEETGVDLPQAVEPEDNTVQYDEFSLGVSVRF